MGGGGGAGGLLSNHPDVPSPKDKTLFRYQLLQVHMLL